MPTGCGVWRNPSPWLSQFPLLRSERVGLSTAQIQPLGRWYRRWWAWPGLMLPAPCGWVASVGLSLATFLRSVHCQAWGKPALLSFAIRAHILASPLAVERGGTAGAQGGLVASTSVRAHGGSRSLPGSGVPRGRSDGNHLGARSPPPSRAAAVVGGLAPPPTPLPAGRGCWGRGAPTARSPDSLSGPGPWGTLVFNF